MKRPLTRTSHDRCFLMLPFLVLQTLDQVDRQAVGVGHMFHIEYDKGHR